MPKQHFVKGLFQFLVFILLKFWGRPIEQAPVFSPFLSFPFFFLTGQTPYEDDFSEDEWLKPLPP